MDFRIKIATFFGICLVFGITLGVLFALRSNHIIGTPSPVEGALFSPSQASLKLVFVGDIMMDRGVEASVNKNFGGDFSKLFLHTDYLKKADIAIANLEGPVSDQGKNVGSKYSFRMDPKIIPVLAAAGFDAVSVANNHAGDWTIDATVDTINRLDGAMIKSIGAGTVKSAALGPVVINQKGISVALFSCSDVGPSWLAAGESNPGIVLCNDSRIISALTQAHQKYDVVIIIPHWGEEYIGYTAREQELAHAWIDAGAHAVIGSHPHVIQSTQWYHDGFIAYSLGNFIFDQSFSPETLRGMVLEMTVGHDGIIAVQPKVSEQSALFQPQSLRELFTTDIITKQAPPKQVVVFTCPKAHTLTYNDLTPVSPDNPIGDYVPSDLVSIAKILPTGGRDICLKQSTVTAATFMVAAAEKAGHHLLITSGFRDPRLQKELFDVDQTRLKADPTLLPIAAAPGTSEHQLGTAMDIVSTDAITLESFSASSDYAWLLENAYNFGFVQSYALNNQSITGYTSEPWHWRYVGIDQAQIIHDQKNTVVTYLKRLKDSL